MHCTQDRPVLASKPSNVSTISSAASATSVASSSRSAGSRLLFGEIDTTSQRSTESYASVCSLVLCDSSTFLKFWLNDECRDHFIQHVPPSDLKNLRLVCHDFSVRAAPALFNDLSISFKTSTFTRPARLAALDRLGFHVKKLRFNLAHSAETFLPPLVDPETGDELSFSYSPQITSNPRVAKYGDCGTTEILTRQYPPLFHAATNVPAFVRAFSSLVNLKDLQISCHGFHEGQRYRRSVVDFALISIRIAIERNHLNALDTLTLSPIHPSSLHYFSPVMGYGADPRSTRCWARIRHLTIHMNALPLHSTISHEACQDIRLRPQQQSQPDHFKLLQSYLRVFQRHLTHFNFRWLGPHKQSIPIQQLPLLHSTVSTSNTNLGPVHPALASRPSPGQNPNKLLHFPNLTNMEVENVTATAQDINAFVTFHKPTLRELNLEDIELVQGNWDEALAPLRRKVSKLPSLQQRQCPTDGMGVDDLIPIMLSPTTTTAAAAAASQANSKTKSKEKGVHFPAKMERVEILSPPSSPPQQPFLLPSTRFGENEEGKLGRRATLRMSRRFLSTVQAGVKDRRWGAGAAVGNGGVVGNSCDGAGASLKKVLMGSRLPWR